MNEHLCRDMKLRMQVPDHGEGERAIPAHDFVYASALSDDPNQGPVVFPCCSRRNLIASIGSGRSMGKCSRS